MALAELALAYGLGPPLLPPVPACQRRSVDKAVGHAAAPVTPVPRRFLRSTVVHSQREGSGVAGCLAQLSASLTLGFCVSRATRRARLRPTAQCGAAPAAPPKAGVEVSAQEGPSPVEEAPEDLREWRLRASAQLQASSKPWPAPKNDRLLRAARGEAVDRPPKWMMRQAGRYLPEYQALLRTTDFFTVCQTPALAAEITLQPFRRYPSLDSLIIFSDILVIPVAMGMPCRMVPEVGPRFDFALETPEDMKKLNLSPNVDETLGFVFDAVFWTRQRVGNEVPVIGFAGAPWTLMGYMVEGGAVRSFDRAKKWLYLYRKESIELLARLRDCIVEYLVGQYDAGAPLLTIFDTNCGELPPSIYEELCVPDLKFIATEVKRRRPHALLSVFPKDGEIGVFNDSAYDVVGVSWTSSPAEARRQCPDKTLQGNLDPYVLYADPALVRETAQRMGREFGVDKYIANLGHGMLPSHPLEGPKAFMEGIDSLTREAPAKAAKAQVSSPTATRSGPPLTLHLEGTSVSLPFAPEGAAKMREALVGFVGLFKKKMSTDGKAQRLENFDYDWAQDGLLLEVFCNPNAFATIFDVKMFLTVRCGEQIKVNAEVPLSALQSDLEAFMA
mmetsp:Transcript_120217/g.256558  ORF Transcript_120217/g.256558 Transcript_120217/m.256558 type:complete len:615 (+) Transcript_120217:77-1921(+)